jgi:agmatinase
LGIKNSHAAAMRRCLDNRNIKLVSFGIRNLCKEEFNYFKKIKAK